MVGIPGRSKGCVTCRKRKKGCDLKRPGCGKCGERAITCGGYEDDQIFIYQHAGQRHGSGLNASMAKDFQDQTALPGGQSTAPSGAQTTIQPSGPLIATCNHSRAPDYSLSITRYDSFARSAFSERSFEMFVHLYIPDSSTNSVDNEAKVFLDLVPLFSSREPAMRAAVLAMGTSLLGKNTNDENLIRQGKTFYGKALKEIAIALRNPERARSSAIFAIPRVMAVYEILFGQGVDATQANSWQSHAEGELALMIMAGPEAWSKTDEAHSLFINARFRPLIAACKSRQATVLNHETWKTLPWKGRTKTPNDALLDVLMSIPEIVERVDKLAQCVDIGANKRESLRASTIAKCWVVHYQLEEWLAANTDNIVTVANTNSLEPITFPNPNTACLTIRYWGFAIPLYNSLDFASGVPLNSTSTSHPDRPHPLCFARRIARTVEYFFQPQFGITGPMTVSFALGSALLQMKRNMPENGPYLGLIMKTLSGSNLPSTIREFLDSMRRSSMSQPLNKLSQKLGTPAC